MSKIDTNELSRRLTGGNGNGNTMPPTQPNNTSVQVTQSNAATCTEIDDLLKDLIFKDTPITPDTYLLTRDGANLFPCANLSILKAQMKSGKTFAATIFAAAVLKEWELQLHAMQDNANVIYIDTEQSPASTKRLRRRITYMYANVISNAKSNVTEEQYNNAADILEGRLIMANLRQYKPVVRQKKIAAIIQRYADEARFVIIDGIKDICEDFNNITAVADTMDFVTNLALERNVHILCILHENPGSDKARGHLGTELYNKATEIINVSRKDEGTNADHFEIKWEAIREGKGVNPVNFKINSKRLQNYPTFAVPMFPDQYTTTNPKKDDPQMF